MQDTPWDRGLEVTADGAGLVGHAGAVILRKLADQSGLTAALREALEREGRFPERDRGVAMASAAVMIALGGTAMGDIAVLGHLSRVLGEPVTRQTLRRTLDLAGPEALEKAARARAGTRAHVWRQARRVPVAGGRRPATGGLDRPGHGCHPGHHALTGGRSRSYR